MSSFIVWVLVYSAFAVFLTSEGCTTGIVDVVEGQAPNVTCLNLVSNQLIYWSVSGSSTYNKETRIGSCSSCPFGSCSCQTSIPGYNITRNKTHTVLLFLENLHSNDGAYIKCSQADNARCVNVTLNTIRAPIRCQNAGTNDCIEIVEDQPTPLTCLGAPDQVIFWSVTRSSTGKTETVIGNCSMCSSNSSTTCPCFLSMEDYNIIRTGDIRRATSVLQFTHNVAGNDKAIIRCSTSTTTLLNVSIDVIPAYKLNGCNNNTITVNENIEKTIECEGIKSAQSLYWSLTHRDGTQATVAECRECDNVTCPACNVTLNGLTVERNQTSSLLRMPAGSTRDNDGAVLTCSRSDNATYDDCQISVQYPGVPERASIVVERHFTVTGRVQVTKVFSSGGVTCLWYYSLDNKTLEVVPQNQIHWDASNFTHNGNQYQQGNCSMTLQLNATEMRHYFHVDIRPGYGPRYAGSVRIEKPGRLITTCPTPVSEGSDLTCTCLHPSGQEGNPPAAVSWRDVTNATEHDVMNAADNDVTREDTNPAELRLINIHNNQSGAEFVCTSVWGAGTPEEVRSYLNYTLLVNLETTEPESPAVSFPWTVLGAVIGVVVFVIVVVLIVVVVVVAKRRASRKDGQDTRMQTNASDADFEEHVNVIYQSSDVYVDAPASSNQRHTQSAHDEAQLAPANTHLYATPHARSAAKASANGTREVTKAARSDDEYNVLGASLRGTENADRVYNHLSQL